MILSEKGIALLFQTQATLIAILFLIGLYFKTHRSRHVKIMSTAIVWDLLLVGQIEWNRGAVGKAVRFEENTWLLNTHVTAAILTVLLYGAMIYTGRKLLKGQNTFRPLHKKMGLSTLGLRLFVYVSSFFISS
ncbi:MAG: hypothetical protein OXB88_11575 [Bacteriovoracales bacterium]|nr:hypothetical protein [Bacteriovoracales bacterium]